MRELQFRQIFGYLAGELRAELIEVPGGRFGYVNELSNCSLAAAGVWL